MGHSLRVCALKITVLVAYCCWWYVICIHAAELAQSEVDGHAATVDGDRMRRALADGIDSEHVLPRVATYRNAYGAHFTCTTTCYFILMMYLITLASFLVILFLIPVVPLSPTDAKFRPSPSPFRLWFGEGNRKYEPVADISQSRIKRGFWARLLSVWHDDEELPVNDSANLAETAKLLVGEEVVVIPPEEVCGEPSKTYKSIGVDTDDLMPMSPPLSPGGRRGSIFANAPPPPPKKLIRQQRIARNTTTDLLTSGSAVSFGASETSFFSDMSLVSRADTARDLLSGGGIGSSGAPPGSPAEKKEQMVRAIERRASIQHRAEKRKEQAKSDISYENLRDEEIQMYEYLEFVRELLEGMVVKKLCQKSTKVVKRTFFITKDMTTVYWNKLGTKNWINKKSSLDASKIEKVLKGFHGNANVETKGKSEKSSLYVSVVCSDGKHLDLEAKDEAMRQRLFVGFSRLASEKRHEQQQQQSQSQIHVADVMTSSMAGGVQTPQAILSAAADDYDDDEEEKPGFAGTADLHPEMQQDHDPEDTRAHTAKQVSFVTTEELHAETHDEPRTLSQTHRGSALRVSITGRHGSLTSQPSALVPPVPTDDPETEIVTAIDVLRELQTGDLEEKEEDDEHDA